MARPGPRPIRLDPFPVEGGPPVEVLATRVVRHLLLRPAWEAASCVLPGIRGGPVLAIRGAAGQDGWSPTRSQDEDGPE